MMEELSVPGGKARSYSPADKLPAEGGTYVLVFQLTARTQVKTKYGYTVLQPGTYAYVGSAFGPGGIRARVGRHLRREKRVRWHIDWITTKDTFKPVEILVFEGERVETQVSEVLAGRFEAVPGFGASDCREESHLFIITSKRSE